VVRSALRSARRAVRPVRRYDRKVAWLSPLPPARTGVATYAQAILDGLDAIGYERPIDRLWPIRPGHEGLVPWYGLAAYHLGNNVEFHRDIYRHAIQTPGLVVIHDLALDDFVHGLTAAGDPYGYQAIREGLTNAEEMRSKDALANPPLRVPFVAHVARRARGIVAHSPFVERYLREFGCRTPVFVVPHPPVERPEALRRAAGRGAVLRGSLEAQGMGFLVGVFGDLNAAKQIDAVLEAVRRLPADVHVVLVGRRIEGFDADAVVRGSGLGGRATLLTDVSDEDFLSWMHAADVGVDLRFPHRGEVSGSLSRAMQAGLPTLVSATGTYLDVPDTMVVRVSPGRPDPAELEQAIGALRNDPGRRGAIGRAAKAHMEHLASTNASARGYADAIEGTLALLHDPSRKALARWAGALADVGVTEERLAQGYGASYARALEELSTPR
jgi:glycosyltransferase involved in cell wall biosynthesis